MRKGVLTVIISLIAVGAVLGAFFLTRGLKESRTAALENTTIVEDERIDFTVRRKWYDELTSIEKASYACIYNEIFDMPDKIAVPDISSSQLQRVFYALIYDNPQLFFMSKECKLVSGGYSSYVMPGYTMSRDVMQTKLSDCLNAAKDICAGASSGTDAFLLELSLHDALIRHVDYSVDGYNGETIVGALLDGKAVCEGYAQSMKLLFDMAGIESRLLPGMAGKKGEQKQEHIWLLVNVDGSWYHHDPTWDDPVSEGEGGHSGPRHAYFNVTTDEISRTHEDFNIPAGIYCYNDEACYFNATGSLSANAQMTDGILSELLASSDDERPAEIKFTDKALLDSEFKRLISDAGIFDIARDIGIDDATKTVYSVVDELNVLELRLTK